MDMQQYAGSESQYLKAADLGGANVKVTISGVELVEFDNDGDKTTKPVLLMRGKEKKLVLNHTNTMEIGVAYGFESDDWVGKEIGLSTKHYPAFGRDGIVVTALGEKQFQDDEIPF